MGKKNKDQEPGANLSRVQNRDIIQRINFLYQASTYVNSIAPPPDGAISSHRSSKKKKNTIRHPKNTAELSRCYVGAMRIIGQKTMVRMYGDSSPSSAGGPDSFSVGIRRSSGHCASSATRYCFQDLPHLSVLRVCL